MAGTRSAAEKKNNSSGQNTQHVHYLGSEGSIHELIWANGSWKHDNLSAVASAPAAASSPTGYVFGSAGTQHVNYTGDDGHIHELWWDGSWHLDDLSAATGEAPGDGGLSAYAFDATSTRHVVY